MDKVKTFVFGCVEWINKHQAFGWGVFILVAACIVGAGGVGYAQHSNEQEQKNVHERMIQRVDNIEVRLDSMEVRQKVMDGKLDLIIRMNTK